MTSINATTTAAREHQSVQESGTDPPGEGATAVISHRVKQGMEAAYEAWLAEVAAVSSAVPGYLDAQLFRPIAGVTSIYTVVLRFDTVAHLKAWLESAQRRNLVGKAAQLLADDDAYVVRSGLDFWFHAPAPAAKSPARWKQVVVTWSAIFPLVLILPPLIGPLLRALGIAPSPIFDIFVVSGASVALMVYLVMPPYVKLIQRWFLS